MDLYAENILDHYRTPRLHELLQDPTATHSEKNLACGDEITLTIKVEDGILTDLGWTGTGCAISQASMSILAEELQGKSVDEVLTMNKDAVYELLGVPIGPRRFKCALMSLHTLKNAIHIAHNAGLQSWVETVAVDE